MIESDPLGLTGGISTYGYAFQEPLVWIDSLGLYAYGDIVNFYLHYCGASGSDTATSFAAVNWGDLDGRVDAAIKALLGHTCSDRTVRVNSNVNAQTGGADAEIIGRHVVRVTGELKVHCNCSWSFSGQMASATGHDTYDFDASNRGLLGEAATWFGRNGCRWGKPFNIHITGSEAKSSSGVISGGVSTCCQ